MKGKATRKGVAAWALPVCLALGVSVLMSGCDGGTVSATTVGTSAITAATPSTAAAVTDTTANTKQKKDKNSQQKTQQSTQGTAQGKKNGATSGGSGADPSKRTFSDVPNALGFPGTVLLGRPTAAAVTFSLLADSDTEAYVEYGFAPGGYVQATAHWSLKAGAPLEADITGLRADSAVYYRLRYKTAGSGDFAATPEQSFHTARAAGSTFTFAVEADPHIELDGKMQPELFIAALQDMQTARPDFLIDLGDTFEGEKLAASSLAQMEAQYAHDRKYFGITGPSIPLYLVNGNHDGEWGWPATGGAAELTSWTLQARTLFFPNPFPNGFYTGDSTQVPGVGNREDYYAWQWGDALFVTLDLYSNSTVDPKQSGDLWDWTLGTEQYRWLETTLRTSTATHKFVFAHHILGDVRGGIEWSGLYEWGGYGKSGAYEFTQKRPGWDTPIHKLFVETGVDIFFQGHDHFFVQQEQDGVIYQEVPQPATPGGDPANQAHEYAYKSGKILGSPGYLLVTVDGAGVRVDYRQAGATVYSYTVQ